MLVLRASRLLSFALAAAFGLSTAPARAEGGSRWIAALPFGAGQFQNGDVGLGIFFAASEAVMGAASIAAVVAVNHLASTDPVWASEAAATNRSIRIATTANHVAFTSWAVLTIAGVAEAQVSFAPQRAARKDLPRPPITTMATPIPGGGMLGIRATF